MIRHKMKCDTDNLTTIFCTGLDDEMCPKSPSNGKQAHGVFYFHFAHTSFPQRNKGIGVMGRQDKMRASSKDGPPC